MILLQKSSQMYRSVIGNICIAKYKIIPTSFGISHFAFMFHGKNEYIVCSPSPFFTRKHELFNLYTCTVGILGMTITSHTHTHTQTYKYSSIQGLPLLTFHKDSVVIR